MPDGLRSSPETARHSEFSDRPIQGESLIVRYSGATVPSTFAWNSPLVAPW
jgi:hypothetical protein